MTLLVLTDDPVTDLGGLSPVAGFINQNQLPPQECDDAAEL